MLRLLWATIALAYGLAMLVATFAWRRPALALLQHESAAGIAFSIAALLFAPAVATWTRFGLNYGECGTPSAPDTDDRLRRLREACPTLMRLLMVLVSLVGLAFAAALFVPDLRVQPFFAFAGVVSGLSGIWFAAIYPTARRMFAGDDRFPLPPTNLRSSGS